MFDPAETLRLIASSIGVVALITVAVGATAPRWPAHWLRRDRGPLHLAAFESVERYRALGFHRLARKLPEAGRAFGGKTKRVVPDRSDAAINMHLVELRRGEWVHWLSNLSAVPLFWLNPWWLTVAFCLLVACVNFTFIGILRLNRLRYLTLSGRLREGA